MGTIVNFGNQIGSQTVFAQFAIRGGAYGGQRQVMADPEAQGGGRASGRERARDGGVSVQTSPRNRRMPEPSVTGKTAEVKSDGQT